MNIHVTYFAILREQRGISEEALMTSATNPAELYHELHARHGFSLDFKWVRAAVNDDFVAMDHPLSDGDRVVFIPPVAGG